MNKTSCGKTSQGFLAVFLKELDVEISDAGSDQLKAKLMDLRKKIAQVIQTGP